jgi:hypothetical protein
VGHQRCPFLPLSRDPTRYFSTHKKPDPNLRYLELAEYMYEASPERLFSFDLNTLRVHVQAGFRVHVHWADSSTLTPPSANSLQWRIKLLGIEVA